MTDVAAFIASVDLLEQAQAGGATFLSKDTPEDRERLYMESLAKYPKNAYAWFHFAKLHLELKPDQAGGSHRRLLAVGEFQRCRDSKDAVPTSHLDAWIRHKYPHYGANITDQERAVAWPFVKTFIDIEKAIALSMEAAAAHLATIVEKAGHKAKASGDRVGVFSGAQEAANLYYRGLQEKQAIVFARGTGSDTLKLSSSKSADPQALSTKYGISMTYVPGEPTEDRRRFEAKKVETQRRIQEAEDAQKAQLAKLQRDLDAQWSEKVGSHRITLASLEYMDKAARLWMEGNRVNAKELRETVAVLEKTWPEGFIKRGRDAVRKAELQEALDKPWLEEVVKLGENSIPKARQAYEKAEKDFQDGPKKENARAAADAERKSMAAIGQLNQDLKDYEEKVWKPALEGYRKAGFEYWPKLKAKLQSSLE